MPKNLSVSLSILKGGLLTKWIGFLKIRELSKQKENGE